MTELQSPTQAQSGIETLRISAVEMLDRIKITGYLLGVNILIFEITDWADTPLGYSANLTPVPDMDSPLSLELQEWVEAYGPTSETPVLFDQVEDVLFSLLDCMVKTGASEVNAGSSEA